ncbi:MAG: CBS domain-containing protein [Candidatus Edwardsbacteria bacterium]|jgi:magnesium and cobalt transporter|nr:CBS domain-containing protein [Candidatus Edwardsbacteria bacterium]
MTGLLARLRRAAAPGPEPDLDALHVIISRAAVQGVVSGEVGRMLQRILSLSDRPLSAVMIPQAAVVAVAAGAGIGEIVDRYLQCGFSRLPVYDGTPDNIIGIIHVKELLRLWRRPAKRLTAVEFIRLPHFFPGTMTVAAALTEFRKRRISVAVVIDEYGAPQGLVTAEDLVEQIVGEMRDELDRERTYHQPAPDGSLVVDADMPLQKFRELTGCRAESRARTVAGLVLERLQRIPPPGERFRIDALSCSVTEGTPSRMIRIRVVRAG